MTSAQRTPARNFVRKAEYRDSLMDLFPRVPFKLWNHSCRWLQMSENADWLLVAPGVGGEGEEAQKGGGLRREQEERGGGLVTTSAFSREGLQTPQWVLAWRVKKKSPPA